jgi:transcriptional regulator with XRE-family HTH domain
LEVLRKELKQKRMTRRKLAESLGVSFTTICNWISGKCSPSFENMDSLKALGFSETACLEPSKDVEV